MADTPSGKFEENDPATKEAARKGGETSGGGDR
jgi:general stress protein YciG